MGCGASSDTTSDNKCSSLSRRGSDVSNCSTQAQYLSRRGDSSVGSTSTSTPLGRRMTAQMRQARNNNAHQNRSKNSSSSSSLPGSTAVLDIPDLSNSGRNKEDDPLCESLTNSEAGFVGLEKRSNNSSHHTITPKNGRRTPNNNSNPSSPKTRTPGANDITMEQYIKQSEENHDQLQKKLQKARPAPLNLTPAPKATKV